MPTEQNAGNIQNLLLTPLIMHKCTFVHVFLGRTLSIFSLHVPACLFLGLSAYKETLGKGELHVTGKNTLKDSKKSIAEFLHFVNWILK